MYVAINFMFVNEWAYRYFCTTISMRTILQYVLMYKAITTCKHTHLWVHIFIYLFCYTYKSIAISLWYVHDREMYQSRNFFEKFAPSSSASSASFSFSHHCYFFCIYTLASLFHLLLFSCWKTIKIKKLFVMMHNKKL